MVGISLQLLSSVEYLQFWRALCTILYLPTEAQLNSSGEIEVKWLNVQGRCMKEEIMRRVKGNCICFVLWRKRWKDITALKFSKIQGPKHDENYDATAAENGSKSYQP